MAGDFYGDQYGGGNRRGDDGLGQDLRGSDGGNVGIAGVALGLPSAPTAPTLTAGGEVQGELTAEMQQLLHELAEAIRAEFCSDPDDDDLDDDDLDDDDPYDEDPDDEDPDDEDPDDEDPDDEQGCMIIRVITG